MQKTQLSKANKCKVCDSKLAYSINTIKGLKLGRISIDLSDELEKQLRFKTVERFGGKKGDLSRAVQEAVKTWVDQKQ